MEDAIKQGVRDMSEGEKREMSGKVMRRFTEILESFASNKTRLLTCGLSCDEILRLLAAAEKLATTHQDTREWLGRVLEPQPK